MKRNTLGVSDLELENMNLREAVARLRRIALDQEGTIKRLRDQIQQQEGFINEHLDKKEIRSDNTSPVTEVSSEEDEEEDFRVPLSRRRAQEDSEDGAAAPSKPGLTSRPADPVFPRLLREQLLGLQQEQKQMAPPMVVVAAANMQNVPQLQEQTSFVPMHLAKICEEEECGEEDSIMPQMHVEGSPKKNQTPRGAPSPLDGIPNDKGYPTLARRNAISKGQHRTLIPVSAQSSFASLMDSRRTIDVPRDDDGDNDNKNNNNDNVPTYFVKDKKIDVVVTGTMGRFCGSYTGTLSRQSEMPYGFGVMKYDPNSFIGLDAKVSPKLYEGSWKDGAWHGQGHNKLEYFSGDLYEGDFENGMRHGLGTNHKKSTGAVYTGEFQKDKRHGKGTLQTPDGSRYTGQFLEGLQHGQGRADFAGGGYYEGGWKNNMYWGKGICVWPDGRLYDGEFVANRSHGRGVEVNPDGTIRHEGEWLHNKPVRSK